MAGLKAVFDTNILIDHLRGVPEAEQELRRFAEHAISVVSWAEVLVGTEAHLEARTLAFLNMFEIVDLNLAVAERAVEIRRKHRIKLPEAVIWATAQTQGALLVTRNSKDFPEDDPGVRIPYRR